jgi:hypothetical protein
VTTCQRPVGTGSRPFLTASDHSWPCQVRETGFEPAWVSPLDPKSSAQPNPTRLTIHIVFATRTCRELSREPRDWQVPNIKEFTARSNCPCSAKGTLCHTMPYECHTMPHCHIVGKMMARVRGTNGLPNRCQTALEDGEGRPSGTSALSALLLTATTSSLRTIFLSTSEE